MIVDLFGSTSDGTPFGHLAERSTSFSMRDYQREDADAIEAAWAAGKRGVICCHATGMGKSVMIAELCWRFIGRSDQRILVVVDSTTLAKDLTRTIRRHTADTVGVLTGELRSQWRSAQVIVATVQSLYAGKTGEERFRELDPSQFGCVLIDECETSIADAYSGALRWFIEQNPAVVFMGCSATPFRGDGRTMGELYDHAADPGAIGPLNRNIEWGYLNGWLVKPKQSYVRCELDFSTLKVRKRADGERDYSDSDIAAMLADADEREIRRLAVAMHETCGADQAIVICPNSVEVAKRVADNLCGASGDECARAIYGAQGEYADDLMDAYKRGEYRFAVSVNKLYKGFDHDAVKRVYMLRKTRSARLYAQALGRGTRPLASIRDALNAEPDAERRRQIIAESGKPHCVMVDLVGVHPSAKDIGVIDIIGARLDPKLRERTKERLLREPGADEDADREGRDVGAAARAEQSDMRTEAQRAAEERERRKRMAVQVGGSVQEVYDDGRGPIGKAPSYAGGKGATLKQIAYLVAMGCAESDALGFSKRQAGKVIQSYKDRGADPNWRVYRSTMSRLQAREAVA